MQEVAILEAARNTSQLLGRKRAMVVLRLNEPICDEKERERMDRDSLKGSLTELSAEEEDSNIVQVFWLGQYTRETITTGEGNISKRDSKKSKFYGRVCSYFHWITEKNLSYRI